MTNYMQWNVSIKKMGQTGRIYLQENFWFYEYWTQTNAKYVYL
jgi:hypothetical protein